MHKCIYTYVSAETARRCGQNIMFKTDERFRAANAIELISVQHVACVVRRPFASRWKLWREKKKLYLPKRVSNYHEESCCTAGTTDERVQQRIQRVKNMQEHRESLCDDENRIHLNAPSEGRP